MTLISILMLFGLGEGIAAQGELADINDVTTEQILAIMPKFDFVNDDMSRPNPASPEGTAYRKKWSDAATKYFEGPTKKLAGLGSAAFPAYRRLLTNFATDTFPHYKEVDLIGRAFERMPEHHENAKDMLFDYLNSIKGREKNDQVAALNYFCKFAIRSDIPRLMQLLDTQEAEVFRRILQLGDDSHLAQLEKWVDENRTTALERMEASGTDPPGVISLRYLQFVEKEIASHKARVADLPQGLPTANDSRMSLILRDGMRVWWMVGGLVLFVTSWGLFRLIRVRRGQGSDGKSSS